MKKKRRFPTIFACLLAVASVFLAAANGQLYLVSNDGKIICFGANQ